MANTSISRTDVGNGYTVVTQVIPSSAAPAGQNFCQTLGPLQKFLKGEPKALGTVQIMIGVLMVLFGIVLSVYPQSISVYSGVLFWGSLIHIIAGFLAVSASNKMNTCVIKGAMVMNIFSTIAAGISIIILSLDLVMGPMYAYCSYMDNYGYGYSYRCSNIIGSHTSGINGVLLVFSLLQFTVSISVSAFACKASCSQPTLSVINVIPNADGGGVPLVSSIPAHHTHAGVSSMNTSSAYAASAPPLESPPAYTEKFQPDN